MRAQFQSSWKSKYDLKLKKKQSGTINAVLLQSNQIRAFETFETKFPGVDFSFCHNGNNFQRKVSDYIVVYHREGFELEDSQHSRSLKSTHTTVGSNILIALVMYAEEI